MKMHAVVMNWSSPWMEHKVRIHDVSNEATVCINLNNHSIHLLVMNWFGFLRTPLAVCEHDVRGLNLTGHFCCIYFAIPTFRIFQSFLDKRTPNQKIINKTVLSATHKKYVCQKQCCHFCMLCQVNIEDLSTDEGDKLIKWSGTHICCSISQDLQAILGKMIAQLTLVSK